MAECTLKDWRARLARLWPARGAALAARRVLVLGDSHVRVFEHWWFRWSLPRVRFDVVYVPGGTAIGLSNPRSATRARTRFDEALARGAHDHVVLNLGEVDTGYTIWACAARDGTDPQQLLERAVQRYTHFITELASRHRLIVVAAPLPTLPDDFEPCDGAGTTRKALAQPLARRTALTLAFNDAVAQACATLAVPHVDDRAASLGPDGTVRAAWRRRGRADHHYARRPYARWLAASLRPWLA
ncbi:MAG: SGNH/GDSL hydrolase family protein [Hydrogenophaga sp.]|uniref:SGNH/GDSL hydrolase family protein n=1 Tax=Hydrogenophaga sp. TaxID=1904254 RepID=UPI0016951CE7|nr:SGNH/GDSL hydrolase family protein [Hydrogenophaga sp.]NIM40913.1 SGNH/GDSL hydrolase family protein [Hydrogenophaga sp.]NIN24755.1 SGNH/GDSL hydrolase family protein [Hydrogenophaga sp.]NIN29267.1 SGNH/GDSL hydrolase family protein [Hydrogenophaga sp.]NIN53790.1 SGNH/GDSL hydrolase family protein [Hydrogenophaga sp.]NIO53170.1 SGNH/GDSL hydrolase family protein [Hydrogenophaga sp.]